MDKDRVSANEAGLNINVRTDDGPSTDTIRSSFVGFRSTCSCWECALAHAKESAARPET
jgi:hypothetical protein